MNDFDGVGHGGHGVQDSERARSRRRSPVQNRLHSGQSHQRECNVQLVESPPGHIDLMVTDISMPGMNGFDLANEVEKRNPAIRRMFISGYHDDLTQRLDTLDDDHYLHKPLTLDDRLTAVRAALTDADSGPL